MTILNYLTVETFRYHNPEYEMRVWIPSVRHVDLSWKGKNHKKQYTGIDYWPLVKNDPEIVIEAIDFEEIGFRNDVSEVFKSDYLRYYLISTYGGIWSDFDIFYLRPISSLLEINPNDFDTLIVYCKSYYPVAFLMGTKDSPFFSHLHKTSIQNYDPSNYQSLGAHLFKSLYKTPTQIPLTHPTLTFRIHSKHLYLPYEWNQLDQIYQNPTTKPQISIGLHLFGGSDIYKSYCNNPLNHKDNSLISKLIQEFIEISGKADQNIGYLLV